MTCEMEKTMLKQSMLALVLTVTVAATSAQAQQKGPNGGTLVNSNGHPIEFVSKDQTLTFYMGDDDGTPLDTKNVQARATVQDGGKTTTVQLKPAAPNLMVGQLNASLGSKARVVFSATFKEGSHSHTLTARYVTE